MGIRGQLRQENHAVKGRAGGKGKHSGEKDYLDHATHHGDDHHTDEDPELALSGGADIADFLAYVCHCLAYVREPRCHGLSKMFHGLG
jgi:hypothetical protein